ncbi:MAG: VOC family protein [Bryobacterales bacterium]|nr:VOC family protein [Bryobacterales bacterium]
MENLIESLLRNFEAGKINRRQLVRSLAVAAGAGSVGAQVGIAAESPIPVSKLDHISYTVADYAKTRDFYSKLLGLKVDGDDGKRQCRLSTGNTVIVARSAASGKPRGVMDHIGLATELKDKPAIADAIKRLGYTPEPLNPKEGGVHVKDPDGYNLQLNPKK